VKAHRALAFGWLLALTLLHLWMIGSGRWPLSADEAHYWDWSRNLDWSYYSKGPLVAYLIALSTKVGGPSEFWVRLPAVLLGTLTALVGYVWSRQLFASERAGFMSLVLLSVMPLYAIGALLMTIDAPFVCCWALAWLCLSRIRERDGWLAWYGAGMAFGVGLLSKYTMFMLVPCVVLWMVASPRLRPWFRRREPYEAAALGLLIFSPVVVWNARHGWYSLRHVLIQAGGGGERPLLATLIGGPEFLATQFGVVSPLLFLWLVVAVCWAWREGTRRGRDDLLLLFFGSAPVFLFFQMWSFFSKVQANWAAHAYLTAAVAAAGWYETWFASGVSRRSRSGLSRFVVASIMLPALALPVAFSPGLLAWIGVKTPPAFDLVGKRLLGWPELGRAVGATMTSRSRAPFVASDRYQIASELAFYVPAHPTVYNANFGRRMNQYDLWGGWQELIGRDGVFVMYGAVDPPEDLRAAFRTVERVRTLVVPSAERPLHTFSIFYGEEFRGFPERPFTGF
jgi:undecaprenyl-diphosphatase